MPTERMSVISQSRHSGATGNPRMRCREEPRGGTSAATLLAPQPERSSCGGRWPSSCPRAPMLGFDGEVRRSGSGEAERFSSGINVEPGTRDRIQGSRSQNGTGPHRFRAALLQAAIDSRSRGSDEENKERRSGPTGIPAQPQGAQCNAHRNAASLHPDQSASSVQIRVIRYSPAVIPFRVRHKNAQDQLPSPFHIAERSCPARRA